MTPKHETMVPAAEHQEALDRAQRLHMRWALFVEVLRDDYGIGVRVDARGEVHVWKIEKEAE